MITRIKLWIRRKLRNVTHVRQSFDRAKVVALYGNRLADPRDLVVEIRVDDKIWVLERAYLIKGLRNMQRLVPDTVISGTITLENVVAVKAIDATVVRYLATIVDADVRIQPTW